MNEEILDKVLVKLINIEEKLDNFVTKDDLAQSENRVVGDVDRFIKLQIEFIQGYSKFCTSL